MRRGRRKKEKEKKKKESRRMKRRRRKRKKRGNNGQREVSRMETVLPIEGEASMLAWRVEGLDSLGGVGQNTETSLNVRSKVPFLSRLSTSIKESFVLGKRKTAQLKT